jgi:cob(I)alamin adenosyltransferase
VLNRANLDGLGGDDVYWHSERLLKANQAEPDGTA